jgi:pimeloyl-ACP methyl ester carboxylesterase
MASKPRFGRFQSLGPHGFHQVAYTEWGDPNCPHIVFCVHGLTRNSRDFDELAASLSDRCRVICMDVAGRGASDWLKHKGDYSFSLYLSDAAALLARVTAPAPVSSLRRVLGRPKRVPKRHVDWIGTSMGGLMGIMLASKRHSPIRRLVLNDVGPLVPWPGLVRIKNGHSGLNKKFADHGEVERFLREACAAFGPLTDAQWQHVAKHSAQPDGDGTLVLAYDPAIITHMRSGSVAGIQFGNEFFFGVDLWPMWDAIRCPTLVLRGVHSDILLPTTAKDMMRRGPKASVVEFDGIGHAPWLMSADQIGTIKDFLLQEPVEAAKADHLHEDPSPPPFGNGRESKPASRFGVLAH